MQTQLIPYTLIEGAETGLANVTTNTTPGYAVIQTTVKASGAAAFRLAHPSPPGPQLLTLNRAILVSANSQLLFKSRLGLAASDEVARVQVSLDQGKSWQDIYSQAGTGTSGEGSFVSRNLSLSSFAGRVIQIRFNYDFSTGSFFSPNNSGAVGWYIDDISVSNAEEAINPVVTDVTAGTSFSFTPATTNRYALQVRAKVYGSYFLDWGPIKYVTPTTDVPPTIGLTLPKLNGGNQFQVDFNVANYRTGMIFQLERTLSLSSGWMTVGNATLQTIVPNSKFRFTAPTTGGSKESYRVTSN
ncbi:MAG: hypothetical protein DME26_21655 [Verrucomicrobia bacterium]|nr:MAG: hypothetical protein DME26_21655 [Verrucomicrobiota bacterium]